MIPLKEFLSWSEENPDAMLEADIRGYILRGLRDSVMRNRKITLNLFSIIFEKPSDNINNREQQQNLFKKLIPELTTCLRINEELDYLILRIVNQALKFLKVVTSPEIDLNFLMCLYDESKSVLEEAKTYFYTNHLKGKTGVNIISKVFNFYKKCPVKNASKLVENFMSYFITQTTWQDWEFFLKSCFDNEVDEYLHILYLYVSFINRPSLHDLDRSTITKMKDEFSVYFSVGWLQLMETDKITMNSNAQIFMLKLATSFNVLKLFKKTLAKMIDWCLNTFCRSHNKEVLDECLSCINYLNSFNKNIEIERSLISQVVTEFIEILNSENEETKILHLSYYKVLLLVKIYEDSCGNLWRSLVSSLEKERDLEKVDLIISILYCLCIKKMFRYFGFEKLSEISNEDLLSEDEKSFQQFILKAQVTSCRTIVIQAASDLICYISNHINENDNFPKIMLVPLLYGELISYSKCPPFSEFISEFSDTSVESYVIYCSRITNTNCQRKGSSPCCVLLNRYVKHTIAGNICTSNLKFFFKNFDKVNSHWLIIIKIFNFLINDKNNPIGAHAMVNGLIFFHNEKKKKFVDEETIKVKLSELTIFILNNLDKVEGKSYQKTGLHLYLYLEKLVREGYSIFTELMEKMQSYLTKEIRVKLVSEYPSIQLLPCNKKSM